MPQFKENSSNALDNAIANVNIAVLISLNAHERITPVIIKEIKGSVEK
jgi:hypothetical protein